MGSHISLPIKRKVRNSHQSNPANAGRSSGSNKPYYDDDASSQRSISISHPGGSLRSVVSSRFSTDHHSSSRFSIGHSSSSPFTGQVDDAIQSEKAFSRASQSATIGSERTYRLSESQRGSNNVSSFGGKVSHAIRSEIPSQYSNSSRPSFGGQVSHAIRSEKPSRYSNSTIPSFGGRVSHAIGSEKPSQYSNNSRPSFGGQVSHAIRSQNAYTSLYSNNIPNPNPNPNQDPVHHTIRARTAPLRRSQSYGGHANHAISRRQSQSSNNSNDQRRVTLRRKSEQAHSMMQDAAWQSQSSNVPNKEWQVGLNNNNNSNMMTLYKPNMPGGYEWTMGDRMKSQQAHANPQNNLVASLASALNNPNYNVPSYQLPVGYWVQNGHWSTRW